MPFDSILAACLPDGRLHPVSSQFLDYWLVGDLPTGEFLRLFHLPNSAYLAVSECLLRTLTG